MTEEIPKQDEAVIVEDQPESQGEKEAIETTHFYQTHQLLEEETEALDEKEIEKIKEIEKKLQEVLKMIEEETMQLSEFVIEEKNLTTESCTLLRGILKKLKISFKIPNKVIRFPKKPKEVILNEEGHLILVYEKGEVVSKLLEEYPPEVVMAVMWEILPELAKSIRIYREKISGRVSFFEKVKRELKNVFKIFTSTGKEGEDEYEKDLADTINE